MIFQILSILLILFTAHATAIEVDKEGYCKIENERYPATGFGTYPLVDATCSNAVEEADSIGYRIIDTATFYDNLEAIGKTLNRIGRHRFYLISKVWPNAHTPQALVSDLMRTLDKLETDYLDCYLLHWPNSQVSIEETLNTMEELRKKKLIRHIGLSNVTINHLKRALEIGVPITWVQVEMHPQFYDAELLKFCADHGITVQAWAPLGRGRLADDPVLADIGKKYQKTPAQIAIRWIIQHGCIPLPCSKNKNHIQQNFDIMDFTLSTQDMETIDTIAKTGKRIRVTEDYGLGFTDEFDFTYEQCWPKKK